jgi:hypothetical protein
VGEDRSQTSRQRVTVAQAAEILGVTVEAVRGRIKRGTLEHERHSGTVYVLLPADQMPTGRQPGDDQATDRPRSDGNALISEMRDRIESLEHQLEQERQANSEHRRLLAAALERIPPQLEAPQETRESPESPGPTDVGGEIWEELGAERVRREMAETTLREGMDEERRRREEAERERDDLRREQYARREPRESPETGEQQQGRGEPHIATGEGKEGARRPWWRRVLGS